MRWGRGSCPRFSWIRTRQFDNSTVLTPGKRVGVARRRLWRARLARADPRYEFHRDGERPAVAPSGTNGTAKRLTRHDGWEQAPTLLARCALGPGRPRDSWRRGHSQSAFAVLPLVVDDRRSCDSRGGLAPPCNGTAGQASSGTQPPKTNVIDARDAMHLSRTSEYA
jgi:hypothetical protein